MVSLHQANLKRLRGALIRKVLLELLLSLFIFSESYPLRIGLSSSELKPAIGLENVIAYCLHVKQKNAKIISFMKDIEIEGFSTLTFKQLQQKLQNKLLHILT